jgi:hypothetical protein
MSSIPVIVLTATRTGRPEKDIVTRRVCCPGTARRDAILASLAKGEMTAPFTNERGREQLSR